MVLCLAASLAVGVGSLPGGPPSAFAQGTNLAKDHVRAGLAYAERGKWEDALREFEEAYALEPSPSTLFDIAQARAQLKRYATASEAYRTLLRDPNSLSASQLRIAKEGLAASEIRIARLVVTDVRPDDVVRVDGTARDAKGPIELDPGAHTVEVVRAGETRESKLAFAEGVRRQVSVDALGSAGPAANDAGPRSPDLPPPPPARDASPTWAWVLGGGGLAVLGTGAVLGGISLSQRADLTDGCGRTQSCEPGAVDDVRTKMVVADVMIGVGLVATVAAAVILLVSSSNASTTQAARAPHPSYW